MNILIGKTKNQVIRDFMVKCEIEDTRDFRKFLSYLDKPKIHITMRSKHLNLIWEIPVLIIGIAATIAMFWEMGSEGFPWIYDGFEGFAGKFVNIIEATFFIFVCGFLIFKPLGKMSRRYDWF